MLENLEKYKIILASNSPRRKELLSGLGIKYEVKTLPGHRGNLSGYIESRGNPLYIASRRRLLTGIPCIRTIDYYC